MRTLLLLLVLEAAALTQLAAVIVAKRWLVPRNLLTVRQFPMGASIMCNANVMLHVRGALVEMVTPKRGGAKSKTLVMLCKSASITSEISEAKAEKLLMRHNTRKQTQKIKNLKAKKKRLKIRVKDMSKTSINLMYELWKEEQERKGNTVSVAEIPETILKSPSPEVSDSEGSDK